MASIVIKLDNKIIAKMKEHYKTYLSAKTPPHAVFAAKKNNITITAYNSGKVMFQGNHAENESTIWESKTSNEPLKEKKKNPFAKPATAHDFLPPAEINTMNFIGSDEAGTGDFFGPVTVAAAYVTPADIPWLKSLGVADSKKLTDKQILKMSEEIIASIPFALVTLNNPKYNEIQANGMTQGKMKAMLHEHAIGHLLRKLGDTKPDGILVDQFCEPSVYFRHTKTTGNREVPIYFRTKAESFSVAVATASIICRTAYVKHMDLISEAFGEEVPKGAGSKVDIFAAKKISENGLDAIMPYIKFHFANTDKSLKLAKRK